MSQLHQPVLLLMEWVVSHVGCWGEEVVFVFSFSSSLGVFVDGYLHQLKA